MMIMYVKCNRSFSMCLSVEKGLLPKLVAHGYETCKQRVVCGTSYFAPVTAAAKYYSDYGFA